MVALLALLTGHTSVRAAYSGLEGIALLATFEPEIILLDLDMPGMDGFETAQRIRSSPKGPAFKLVAHTARPRDAIETQTRESGFDCILSKPADFRDLCRNIYCESDCEANKQPCVFQLDLTRNGNHRSRKEL